MSCNLIQHPSITLCSYGRKAILIPHPNTNTCYHTDKPPLTFDLQEPHPFFQIPRVLCWHLGLISRPALVPLKWFTWTLAS